MLPAVAVNLFRTIERTSVGILALALLACCPSAAETQQSCSWLNAATAEGFLGGPVTITVTGDSKPFGDATCEFVRQQDKQVSKLRIEVDTVAQPHDAFATYAGHCGHQSAPMTAIGNEAVICSRKEKHHVVAERVVGRVRDRIFLLDVSSNVPHADQANLQKTAEQISQQVAGILF